MGDTVVTSRMAAPEADPGAGAAPFWTFSLALYGRPGVAEACLSLQDDFAADVNLLLFAAWLGRRGIRLDSNHLEAARDVSLAWHGQVTTPLRAARRQLKARAGAEAQALREQVKASELEAERLEQMALQALATAWPRDGAGNAEDNLRMALPAAGAAAALGLIARAALAVPCD